jgi:hypothetical protein
LDLLLNTDITSPSFGDLTFKNGPLLPENTTQSRVDVVAQRLFIKLRTFTSEWFLDTSYGIPYWSILGQKISQSDVDIIFQREILAESGVKELTFFESSMTGRSYSLTFRVKVTTGDETSNITITPPN